MSFAHRRGAFGGVGPGQRSQEPICKRNLGMPTAPAVVCEGDACALERPAGDAKDPESGTASNDVLVYSRWSCSLCWITKWALWWHGVRYITRSIDYDRSWEDAIDRSGFTGGSFMLPVVVHGDKAWWNIASNAALAAELKSRGAGAVAVAEVAAAAAAATY